MGSGSSRLVSRPAGARPRWPINTRISKRSLSSLFICGASSSRPPVQLDDEPAEFLVDSAERSHRGLDKFQCSKNPSLTSGIGSECKTPSETRSLTTPQNMESGGSFKCCMGASTDSTTSEEGSGNNETSNDVRCPYKSRELVPSNDGSNFSVSTSIGSPSILDPLFENGSHNTNSINDMTNTANRNSCTSVSSAISSLSASGLGDSSPEISVGNYANEVPPNHLSASTSVLADSPLPFSVRESSFQEASPSGLGFLVSEMEEGWRDASLLHVDVVSISSDILSGNLADASNREARRNSRRLFWDAFSRRNSRRHSESQNTVFSTNDSDDLGSHDRWLLDFSGDFFSDGVASDSRSMRNHDRGEQRRHSRSEIRERIYSGIGGTGHGTSICPSGLHPEGCCSCASTLMAEGSGTRASISRIVLLAEALFEVLDEIHRQPVSLSLSMVSLPAPASIVDSFPVRSHTKHETANNVDDVAQCYICLDEYEEGAKIRVLPCKHEFHLTCVDKWLKDIHGVCPLCRGDVGEGSSEGSVSLHSEITSTQ